MGTWSKNQIIVFYFIDTHISNDIAITSAQFYSNYAMLYEMFLKIYSRFFIYWTQFEQFRT